MKVSHYNKVKPLSNQVLQWYDSQNRTRQLSFIIPFGLHFEGWLDELLNPTFLYKYRFFFPLLCQYSAGFVLGFRMFIQLWWTITHLSKQTTNNYQKCFLEKQNLWSEFNQRRSNGGRKNPDQCRISGKLPTYPSLNLTFCLKRKVSVDVRFGEG